MKASLSYYNSIIIQMTYIIQSYVSRYLEPNISASLMRKRSIEEYKQSFKYYELIQYGNKVYRNKDQLSGLRNIGNTCYFNTVIQLLYHINCLRDLFLTFPSQGNDKAVIVEFKKLFGKMLMSKFSYADPTALFTELNSINTDMIALGQQHDFSEYLIKTLEKLQKQLGKEAGLDGKNQNRYIEKVFFGKMSEELNYEEVLTKDSVPFGVITLDPKYKNLQESLERFKVEEIQGFKNEKGEAVSCKKNRQIIEYPAILTFSLNRVQVVNGKYVKNNIDFNYPKILQFNKQKVGSKMSKEEQIIEKKIQKIRSALDKKEYKAQLEHFVMVQKFLEFQQFEDVNEENMGMGSLNGRFGIFGNETGHQQTKKRLRFYIQQLEKQEENLLANLKKLEAQKRAISQKNKTKKYDLFALIIHSGDVNSGHYYLLIYNQNQNKWRKYNDRIVSELTEQEVRDIASGKSNKNTNVCSLLYKMSDFICDPFQRPSVSVTLKEQIKKQDEQTLEKMDDARIERMIKNCGQLAKEQVEYLKLNINLIPNSFINYFHDIGDHFIFEEKYGLAELIKLYNIIREESFNQQLKIQCSSKRNIQIPPIPIGPTQIGQQYLLTIEKIKIALHLQNSNDLSNLSGAVNILVHHKEKCIDKSKNQKLKFFYSRLLSILLFKLCFVIDLKQQRNLNVKQQIQHIMFALPHISDQLFRSQILNNLQESLPGFQQKTIRFNEFIPSKFAPIETLSILRMLEGRFKLWLEFASKIERTNKVIGQDERKQKEAFIYFNYID